MSEQSSTPIETAESPGDAQRQPAQPIVPLQRQSVQATIAFLAITSLAIIVTVGWATMWHSHAPQRIIRPAVLLQIDINQADDREFALLPRVGPVLAKRIVDDRDQHGRFTSIADLTRVPGIGEKTVAQIAVYCLPVGGDDAMVALAND